MVLCYTYRTLDYAEIEKFISLWQHCRRFVCSILMEKKFEHLSFDETHLKRTKIFVLTVTGKDWVTMSEFEYSHDKHVLGTDWKSRVRDKEDLKITAYHEAGHTLVFFTLLFSDFVFLHIQLFSTFNIVLFVSCSGWRHKNISMKYQYIK